MLQLHQLETFLAVVDAGGFTAAARQLNITQPAVSQHVKSLEEQLGAQLIDRQANPVSLTQAGALLARRAREILSRVAEVEEEVGDLQSGNRGLVRVAAGSTTCIYELPGLIAAYRSNHPAVEITISSGTTKDIVRLLEEREIDVGIVTSQVDVTWLAQTPLFQDEIILVGASSLFREGGMGRVLLDPGEVAEYPFVSFKQGHGFRDFINEVLKSLSISPDIAIEMDNVEAIKALVKNGLGLGFLPRSAATSEAEDLLDGLLQVEIRGLQPLFRTTSMIVHRERYLSAACREFMKFTVEWFKGI